MSEIILFRTLSKGDKIALLAIPGLIFVALLGFGAITLPSAAHGPNAAGLPLISQPHYDAIGASDALPDVPAPRLAAPHKHHAHKHPVATSETVVSAPLPPLLTEPAPIATSAPEIVAKPAPIKDDADDEDDGKARGKWIAFGAIVLALIVSWSVVSRYRLAKQMKSFAERAETAAVVARAHVEALARAAVSTVEADAAKVGAAVQGAKNG